MNNAVEVRSLGKMYKLFDKQSDRIRDIFGIDKFCFWDREPKYREFWALRNVDLIVPKGERIGIIGRNGAGKSTLLKLIVGNLKPTEGTVAVHGNIQALLQMGTGFHPEFTGLENIRTALAYAGMTHREIEELVDDIIDFSELEDYIHQPVKYYSAGMYSRLAFAVATSLEPDILIIDEVLGAGDASFTTKCAERMKHLTQDTGATVLFVSHSMDSVLEICDRAILLERGEITHRGTALEVSKIYNKKIREEEELRVRAKEFRVSRKNMLGITQADEANQVLVMRLVCDGQHPRYTHLIYSCDLQVSAKTISTLHFGAPTDDDESQFTHVIVEKGAMDWSVAKKDRGNFYRAYRNEKGINCHAPFQMAIPMHLSMEPLTVCMKARPDSREKIYLEYFDGHEYRRLGEVQNGQSRFSFQLQPLRIKERKINQTEVADEKTEPPQKINAPKPMKESFCGEEDTDSIEEPETVFVAQEELQAKKLMLEATDLDQMKKSNSVYGSQELVIKKLDIVNAEGKSSRNFETGESLRFQIHLKANQSVSAFVVVVCIMTRTGKVATQVFCNSKDIGITSLEGEGMIEACFSPLRIGEGEYMVSIGVFKQCDMSRNAEEPSYCVADRSLFFKVEQPFGIRKSLGSVLHTCDWKCGKASHQFDGAMLKKED